jgi:hypothetical protein
LLSPTESQIRRRSAAVLFADQYREHSMATYRENEVQVFLENGRHCREQAEVALNETDRAAWRRIADQWAALAAPRVPPVYSQNQPANQPDMQEQAKPKDGGNA